MEANGSPPRQRDVPATTNEEGALPVSVTVSAFVGGAAAEARDYMLPETPLLPEESVEPRSAVFPQDPSLPSSSGEGKPSEILRALEVVERDSVAIAESYACLFSSLRMALSEATSTSLENMQCFSDIVGNIQETALDAATKGNRFINSCVRLNAEMKGLESLAVQLKILRKSVDSLDLAVNRILRLS